MEQPKTNKKNCLICGKSYTISNKSAHDRSKYHQDARELYDSVWEKILASNKSADEILKLIRERDQPQNSKPSALPAPKIKELTKDLRSSTEGKPLLAEPQISKISFAEGKTASPFGRSKEQITKECRPIYLIKLDSIKDIESFIEVTERRVTTNSK